MERDDFIAGVHDCVPAVPPNVPFGMLFGATAVQVGIGPMQATALSLFGFAGAAQMAAVKLLDANAALPLVLATVFVVNLRYVIYSASLEPTMSHLPRRWRAAVAYALFDVNFALVAAKFGTGDGSGEGDDAGGAGAAVGDGAGGTDEADEGTGAAADAHPGWYYLGATLPIVATFVVSTLVGALAGVSVGEGLSLEFAIPLIFIALLVPTLDSAESALAAAVACVVAVAGAGLPFNAGLLVAAACGVAAGAVADRVDGPAGVR